jgi:DNA-binding CsgD family transcriptional regulator
MAELNSRELKLLKLVCQDKNNGEIATKLGMSLRYTERLKARLHAKTKTKSNVGLLKWAVINGLYVIKK